MNPVRLALVGLGNMGAGHARRVVAGEIPGLQLAAVCDPSAEARSAFPDARPFADAADFFRAPDIDAVLIATPHYSHRPLSVAALAAGLHVLVEKPVAVQAGEFDELRAAANAHPQQVFAAVFNQRTDPAYQKIRALLCDGTLGAVRRWQWTITDWFRPDCYYRLGSWRATWAGEGGGILVNQCPHNLDLTWWFFGAPSRVRAHCHFGKHHGIEVEDEVTAYLEYPGGATGVFIASTGEAPGTNRLEIAGDNGRLVFERGRLTFTRNLVAAAEFSRTATQPFSAPATEEHVEDFPDRGPQHAGILADFAAAIRESRPPLAPALEGLHSVALANAMLLSTWEDRTIDFPLDTAAYARALDAKIAASAPKT
jgi:predicted dehydrogenase